MASENKDDAKQSIEKVSVKLPPFWVEKPEIWFSQVEAQFNLIGITNENTKFNYLMAQLDLQIVENIWDLVSSNEENKYSIAKERLLTIYRESEERQIKKLVSEIELGDLKPSQLLRKMKGLGGTEISDKLLKTLWLDKLPQEIRSVLVIADGDVNKLADIGDKIWELKSPGSVDEVRSVTSTSNPTSVFSLHEIMDKICELERQLKRRDSGNSRTRSRSRSRSRPRYKPQGKYCYYHFRFGSKCKPEKCVSPCQWNAQGNSRQQPL